MYRFFFGIQLCVFEMSIKKNDKFSLVQAPRNAACAQKKEYKLESPDDYAYIFFFFMKISRAF